MQRRQWLKVRRIMTCTCQFAPAHDAVDGKNSVGMYSQSRPGHGNGGIEVSPSDSPPPRRMAELGDHQPGSLADRREGGPRRDRFNDLTDAAITRAIGNSGLLRPDERPVLVVRRHPAVLTGFVIMTLAVLAVAGTLSDHVKCAGKSGTIFRITLFHHAEKVVGQSGSVPLSIWVVWCLVLLYLVYKVFSWTVSCFVITDRQMILIASTLVRRFASVPISKVTNWYLRESFGGRMLGYTSLAFESSDDGRVRTIGYVPGHAVETIVLSFEKQVMKRRSRSGRPEARAAASD